MDYGQAWRRLRDKFVAEYPLCFVCGAAATQVDHIDGLGINGPRAYDWSNLQSLCRSCHGKKTVRQDGGFGRWAADGKPLDQ
jgi:5-methylcytosine-specific restriction enzyme A